MCFRAEHLVSDNQFGVHPKEGLILLSQLVIACSSVSKGWGYVRLPPFCRHINRYHHCLGLASAAILLRFHECSFPATCWRHTLTKPGFHHVTLLVLDSLHRSDLPPTQKDPSTCLQLRCCIKAVYHIQNRFVWSLAFTSPNPLKRKDTSSWVKRQRVGGLLLLAVLTSPLYKMNSTSSGSLLGIR